MRRMHDHCRRCGEGDETLVCMRRMPEHKGKCPICDAGIELDDENKIVVDIFKRCEQRGIIISDTYRDLFFVRPGDVLATMEMMDVPQEERDFVFRRVLIYETECNKWREARPKRSK